MTEECKGKVIIKCLPNERTFLKYEILVFNIKHETIYHGHTSEKGMAKFQVNAYDEYEIRVQSPKYMSPKAASRWVRLSPYKTCDLNFIFNIDCFLPCIKKSTFHFTDQNYVGLPIIKGELYLWRNHM